ncbi:MAG: uroporphyrinogen-III synthase [Nocardioidaceae bacterium]
MSTLAGYRVGITSSRKVDELTALLERRGAQVESAPALRVEEGVDPARLRAATRAVLADPPDVFVATTGTGVRRWFAAAAADGQLDDLVAVLSRAQVLARGQKAVGALRAHGIREMWTSPSERLSDLLAHLRVGPLTGRRVVVQEHGRSLSTVAGALRMRGADVTVVSVYRCDVAADLGPLFRMVDLVADRHVDAVTFTSAPAVGTLMDVATAAGRLAEVVAAFSGDVLAACVGPVTADAFDPWRVPTVHPARSRLAAMVKTLETELPQRRQGTVIDCGRHRLLLHGDIVCVDGVEKRLSPGPRAVLDALAARPGHVVGRQQLVGMLPRGSAGSEHAVEMAVARLRRAVGAPLVQTVTKRGYRLQVAVRPGD